MDGLTGPEIGYVLQDMAVEDPSAGMTKWKRIFNALALLQNKHQVGNHLLMFINRAMSPARFVARPRQFTLMQDGLNVALSLAGYGVDDQGRAVRTTRETTVAGAVARAKRLKSTLEARGTHAEVFAYCTPELLDENYFHAVLEAIKGIAERLRKISGLTCDGADLITTRRSRPRLRSSLSTVWRPTPRSASKRASATCSLASLAQCETRPPTRPRSLGQ